MTTESKPRDWQHNLSEQEVVNSIREVCIKKDVMFDFGKKEFVAFSVERLWLQAMVKYYDQLQVENKKLREAMQFAIDHLSSMDDYSIVNGAIHSLKEALSSGGE